MIQCSGFALCVLLMFSSGCASQLSAVLDESQTEVEGFVSFYNQESVNTLSNNQESVNTLSVVGTTLFHMSPSFQLGPRARLVRRSEDGASNMYFQGGAEARYNLSTEGDILPFFGGSLGFVRVSGDDGAGLSDSVTGFAWALNGGVRVPVTPGGFLVTKIEWENFSIDDFDSDSLGVFAGFSIRY